jgi:hypothetical protein
MLACQSQGAATCRVVGAVLLEVVGVTGVLLPDAGTCADVVSRLQLMHSMSRGRSKRHQRHDDVSSPGHPESITAHRGVL